MAKDGQGIARFAAGLGAGIAARGVWRWRTGATFTGQVVVITGGSRGLGLVLARQLADEGAKLALLARDEGELGRAKEEIAGKGADVLTVPCDVTEQASVDNAITQIFDHYGRIDMLINDAGTIQVGPTDHMQFADYETAMATNMWGALYTILAVLPHMRTQGGGRIVNIASFGGLVSVPHLLPYSVSKHALVGLSKGLQAELAKDRIHVTTVCPGELRTGAPPNAFFKGRQDEEYAWFAAGDSVPGAAMAAGRTARQILDAARHNDGFVVITLSARLLWYASVLAPNLFGRAMVFVNSRLPKPTGVAGDVNKTGWESISDKTPKALTSFSDKATADNNGLRGHAPLT